MISKFCIPHNPTMSIRNLSLSFISVLLSLSSFAQSPDTNSPGNKLNTFYNQHIGKSAIIYSGSSYVTPMYPREGSPFLTSDTLTLGWISYDGQYYKEVLLQWDVLQNYVLTRSLVSKAKMILRNDLIDSFSFAGHLVKFMPRDPENNLMKEGLYDILYAGPTTLMARRKKVTRERKDSKTVIYEISDKNSYYIRKKGIYYQVSNKKDVVDLFAKDLVEIKKIVRQNKLKWKKNLEQILRLAVVNYDKPNPIK